MDSAIGAALKIDLSDVVGAEAKPEHGFESPTVRVTVTKEKPAPTPPPGGAADAGPTAPPETTSESTIIEVGAAIGSDYYVRVLGEKYVVRVPKSGIGKLVDLTAQGLLKKDDKKK